MVLQVVVSLLRLESNIIICLFNGDTL